MGERTWRCPYFILVTCCELKLTLFMSHAPYPFLMSLHIYLNIGDDNGSECGSSSGAIQILPQHEREHSQVSRASFVVTIFSIAHVKRWNSHRTKQ
jgi:hypothetical protein